MFFPNFNTRTEGGISPKTIKNSVQITTFDKNDQNVISGGWGGGGDKSGVGSE